MEDENHSHINGIQLKKIFSQTTIIDRSNAVKILFASVTSILHIAMAKCFAYAPCAERGNSSTRRHSPHGLSSLPNRRTDRASQLTGERVKGVDSPSRDLHLLLLPCPIEHRRLLQLKATPIPRDRSRLRVRVGERKSIGWMGIGRDVMRD